MKLIIGIVSREDAGKVTKTLIENNFFVTKLSSTGGFLRGGNVTLMTGVQDESVSLVLNLIKDCCQSRKEYISNPFINENKIEVLDSLEVTVGGATIFVVDVCDFKKV